jgi:hypothetical protein
MVALKEERDLFVAMLIPTIQIPIHNPNSKLGHQFLLRIQMPWTLYLQKQKKDVLVSKFTLYFIFCKFTLLSHLLDCIAITLVL